MTPHTAQFSLGVIPLPGSKPHPEEIFEGDQLNIKLDSGDPLAPSLIVTTPLWVTWQRSQYLGEFFDLIDPATYIWSPINGVGGRNVISNYTLTDADVGRSVRAVLQYQDSQFIQKTTYTPPVSLPIQNVDDSPVSTLRVVGGLAQGQLATLTGSLSDADFLSRLPTATVPTEIYAGVEPEWVRRYEWYAVSDGSGRRIEEASTHAFLPGQDEAGSTLEVRVYYWNPDGQSEETITVRASSPVQNVNDLPTGFVWIEGYDGVPYEHDDLIARADLADLDGPETIIPSWQWYANAVPLADATQETLRLTAAHIGKEITAKAFYVDRYGAAETFLSPTTGKVVNRDDEFQIVAKFEIDGEQEQGKTVSLSGAISDADGIVNSGYRWWIEYHDGRSAEPVAYGKSLTLNEEIWVGNRLVGEFWFVDGFSPDIKSVEVVSGDLIKNRNDLPLGGILISGGLKQGEELTTVVAFTDADGVQPDSFEWQWFADGRPIGETQTQHEGKLTLTQAEVGKRISLTLNYADNGATPTTETLTYNAPRIVEDINDPAEGEPIVRVVGAPEDPWGLTPVKESDLLEVNTSGLSDPDGIDEKSFRFQWMQNNQPIAGATSRQFMPGQLHVGSEISVLVTYSDGGGYVQTITAKSAGLIENIDDLPSGWLRIEGVPPSGLIEGVKVTVNTEIVDEDFSASDGKVPRDNLIYQWWVTPPNSETSERFPVPSEADGSFVVPSRLTGELSVTVSYLDPSPDEPGRITDFGDRTIGTINRINHPVTGTIELIYYESTYSEIRADSPAQGQTVFAVGKNLADEDDFDKSPEISDWQWFANDIPITGATSDWLVLDQFVVGKRISVQGSYSDEAGFAESLKSAESEPVINLDDPADFSGVALLGPLAFNEISQGARIKVQGIVFDLDEANGTVPAEKLHYEWMIAQSPDSEFSPIPNADSAEIMLPEDCLVGSIVKVRVSVGPRGSDYFDFDPLTVIGKQDGPGVAIISGESRERSILEVNIVDPDGVDKSQPIVFEWTAYDPESRSVVLVGDGSYRLALDSSLIGHEISVVVNYTDGAGFGELARGKSANIIENTNDFAEGNPTINWDTTEGLEFPAQGQTVWVDWSVVEDRDGLPTDQADYSIQWLLDGVAISGETGQTLLLGQKYAGRELSVRINFTDRYGSLETVYSEQVSILDVDDPTVGEIKVEGDLTVGNTIRAVNALSDPDGIDQKSVSYVWKINDEEIATGPSLLLSRSMVGANLSLTTSWVDNFGRDNQISQIIDRPVESFSLSGNVFHWRSLALMNDVTIIAVESGTSEDSNYSENKLNGILELRNVFCEPSSLFGDIWLNPVSPTRSAEFSITESLEWTFEPIPESSSFWETRSVADVDGRVNISSVSDQATTEAVRLGKIRSSFENGGGERRFRIQDFMIDGVSQPDFDTIVAAARSGHETTGLDGAFAFPGVDYGNYKLKASYSGPANNAIDMEDLLATLKISLGRNPNPDLDGSDTARPLPVSPFQVLAADFTNDGHVDKDDVAQLALAISSKEADRSADWFFTDPEAGAGQPVENFQRTNSNTNLVAILRGDVDGSWKPVDSAWSSVQSFPTYQFEAGSIESQLPEWYFGLIQT